MDAKISILFGLCLHYVLITDVFMFKRDENWLICNMCTWFFMEAKLTVSVSHNNIMHQVGIPQMKPRWHAFSKVIYYK